MESIVSSTLSQKQPTVSCTGADIGLHTAMAGSPQKSSPYPEYACLFLSSGAVCDPAPLPLNLKVTAPASLPPPQPLSFSPLNYSPACHGVALWHVIAWVLQLRKMPSSHSTWKLKSPAEWKQLSPRPSSQSQSQEAQLFEFQISSTSSEGFSRGTGHHRAGFRCCSPMAPNQANSQSKVHEKANMVEQIEPEYLLHENNKDAQYQKVKVKAEPMEVDPPPAELTPPASHLLAFSTLGASEKSEPMSNLPETLARPQKDLFSQDISVKMASELLFKLSEKVSKANNHKDSNMVGINSPFLDECFRQSPFNSRSKSSSPAEASSSTRAAFHDSEKDDGEPGNGIAQWRLNEQLFPCPVCGKVFGRQQTLSRHLSLHTEERKYKCHLCPYAAKCRANLNQHLTIHSVKLVNTDAEQIVSAVTADSAERKNCPYYYSCHVCGFQTELNAQFVSHMSLHVDKEQWMFSLCCSVCDYVCMEENDMKNHISTGHAGLNSRSPLSETKSTSSSLSALSDSLNSSEGGDLTHDLSSVPDPEWLPELDWLPAEEGGASRLLSSSLPWVRSPPSELLSESLRAERDEEVLLVSLRGLLEFRPGHKRTASGVHLVRD
ncbi:zinc finger protein 827 [Lates japonicus]|uniref:Zinc finger protein 827 n=1 Tax=Lates japonicus TaxID=270547 RepID=A0AAD3RJY8_LATJO|nr:zinc finger protein 827 [Lates japonicus]